MANLTPREIALKNQLYNQYKATKADEFVDKYEAEAEQVMLGRAITLAKQMAANENKKRIKEAIKQILGTKPNDTK